MAAGDGLISMTPTSIAHSGTSASINADGGVDFTAVTSLSLNGVFTSDYDNYLIVCNGSFSFQTPGLFARLRASGSDASGTNYTQQYILASSTSVSGARTTSATSFAVAYPDDDIAVNGMQMHIYGPSLSQPTAHRSVNQDAVSSARITDTANTHSLSTSYDGITFFPGFGNMTGNIHVFGYEE